MYTREIRLVNEAGSQTHAVIVQLECQEVTLSGDLILDVYTNRTHNDMEPGFYSNGSEAIVADFNISCFTVIKVIEIFCLLVLSIQ